MNREEILALIQEALANAGFVKQSDLNPTAALIRGLKESVEALKGQNPLETLVSLGLLEKASDGSYRPKVAGTSAKKDNEPEPEWKVELKKMQEQLAAKDRQLAAEKQQREQAELRSAVIAALEKAGAVNPGRDYVHVIQQVKRAEDGSFFVSKTNDYGVEEKGSLEAAFIEFLKANPELRKASGHAGSGTPGNSHVPGKPVNNNDIDALAQLTTEQYFAQMRQKK